MGTGCLGRKESTGRFNNVLGTDRAPLDVGWLHPVIGQSTDHPMRSNQDMSHRSGVFVLAITQQTIIETKQKKITKIIVQRWALMLARERTSLDQVVNCLLVGWYLMWNILGENRDGLSVDDELTIVVRHFGIQTLVDRIVLEHVDLPPQER
jgi:hypothetical protein